MLDRDGNGDFLFPIRSAPGRYFDAGRLSDGRQALIARSIYGNLIAAIFDDGGNLKQVIREDYPNSFVSPTSGAVREVNDDDFEEYLVGRFGFRPGLIRIKEFRMPEDLFGVYHLPEHYQKFLANPQNPNFDDDSREAFPGLIRQWNELGQFVLEWGNDFWLDSTGEVVSS